MGEFLSTPIKDKISEENENTFVFLYFKLSAGMEHQVCKGGEKEWRILISQISL
jgi:hypothetical protein